MPGPTADTEDPRQGGTAMITSPTTESQLAQEIAAERREFAEMLSSLPAQSWNSATLCAGWRVRELVAHMTMPFRYSTARFVAEIVRSGGRFNAMADRCARRDGAAPASELLSALRDNADNPWTPPGGGLAGALTHDVIHGLDAVVPLGTARRVPHRAAADRPGLRQRAAGAQALRHRPERHRAPGRRPRLVVRVRAAASRRGAGSRARHMRPEAARRPAAR